MHRRLQGLLSLDVLLIAGLVLCMLGYVTFPRKQDRVLLVDRPRADFESADFVLEFLEVTQTPYELEHGFVAMEASPPIEARLLQLLSCLSTAIGVAEHNLNAPQEERLRCFPNPTGEVHVVSDAKNRGVPVLRDQQQLQSLQRQQGAILAAIQYLNPGAVGKATVGSAETIASLPIPLQTDTPAAASTANQSIQQVSAWQAPVSERSRPPLPPAVAPQRDLPPAGVDESEEQIVDLDEMPSEPGTRP